MITITATPNSTDCSSAYGFIRTFGLHSSVIYRVYFCRVYVGREASDVPRGVKSFDLLADSEANRTTSTAIDIVIAGTCPAMPF